MVDEEACDHPTWQQGSDGHTRTWWNCTVCGKYSWIAPWVLWVLCTCRKTDNNPSRCRARIAAVERMIEAGGTK